MLKISFLFLTQQMKRIFSLKISVKFSSQNIPELKNIVLRHYQLTIKTDSWITTKINGTSWRAWLPPNDGLAKTGPNRLLAIALVTHEFLPQIRVVVKQAQSLDHSETGKVKTPATHHTHLTMHIMLTYMQVLKCTM